MFVTGEERKDTVKRVDLPISRLSLAQKLDLMETLWADLARDEKKLESPAWHRTVLEDREKALMVGKVTVSDWEQTKRRIRKKCREARRLVHSEIRPKVDMPQSEYKKR
jgi:putative addiction module component (TIGR02574 family)